MGREVAMREEEGHPSGFAPSLRCPAREYSWAISNEAFRNKRDNHES